MTSCGIILMLGRANSVHILSTGQACQLRGGIWKRWRSVFSPWYQADGGTLGGPIWTPLLLGAHPGGGGGGVPRPRHVVAGRERGKISSCWFGALSLPPFCPSPSLRLRGGSQDPSAAERAADDRLPRRIKQLSEKMMAPAGPLPSLLDPTPASLELPPPCRRCRDRWSV